jgi:hypothetical protein
MNRLQLYSVKELFDLPEPEWQIENIFQMGSRVVVYGGSGEGKSFLALHLALSIAQGRKCMRYAVRQGAVVYVAGEGGRSIRKRIDAWTHHHHVENVSNVFFLLEGIQVHDEAGIESLLATLQERCIEPTLIVLDTLARCFVGGDENSSQEMGEFVAGMERLLKATGATVMVVHHTGRGHERERGSTALRGAADVMIGVSKKNNRIIVKNDKQKDDEEFLPIELELRQVVLPGHTSAETTSCVLVPRSGNARGTADVVPDYLHKTLKTLCSLPNGIGTRRLWIDKADLPHRTLDSHCKALVRLGYVEPVKRGLYKVTELGRAGAQSGAQSKQGIAVTASKLQLVNSSNSPSRAAATATTRKGGSSGAGPSNPVQKSIK